MTAVERYDSASAEPAWMIGEAGGYSRLPSPNFLLTNAYLSSPSKEHQTFLLIVSRPMERQIHTSIFTTHY